MPESMTDTKTTLSDMKKMVDDFLTERDWYQFHNPRTDSVGLVIEAGELLAPFLFAKPGMGGRDVLASKKTEVGDELSDVLVWLFCIALVNKFSLTTLLSSALPGSLFDEDKTTLEDLKKIVSREYRGYATPERAVRAVVVTATAYFEFLLKQSQDDFGYDGIQKYRSEVEHLYVQVFLAVLHFAIEADLDLSHVFQTKMEKNRKKYPIEKSKGTSLKYNEL